jgi:hypothetical protein
MVFYLRTEVFADLGIKVAAVGLTADCGNSNRRGSDGQDNS